MECTLYERCALVMEIEGDKGTGAYKTKKGGIWIDWSATRGV